MLMLFSFILLFVFIYMFCISLYNFPVTPVYIRIGFATAKRLGEEGAKVVVSSRKEKNVKEAVKKLKDLNIDASGVVCHQGQHVDRKRLIDHVSLHRIKCSSLFSF